MESLKILFEGLNGNFVYLVLLVLFLFLKIFFRREYSISILIWAISLPLSIYCYFVYVYGVEGPAALNITTVMVILLAFSQLGWLGVGLALAAFLRDSSALKLAGFWVSVGSVASHGIFLVLVHFFFWSGS